MALKVIGAGLGRTGTMSLKLALEHLGMGPCYHMAEVLSNASRNIPLWADVAAGKPDWDAIFDGFASTVDYPTCTFWRELADRWPEAKVILSTRDPESWFASVNSTILSPDAVAHYAETPMAVVMQAAVMPMFAGGDLNDREFMVETYNRHVQSVIDRLPADRLLVFNARDGWEPLCKFLGVPVPDEPYPNVNTKEDMLSVREVAPPDPQEFGRLFLSTMREKAFGKGAA